MSRYKYQGTFTDGNGAVIGAETTANSTAGTVSVYLAGTETAASVYAAESGGTAVNSVETDDYGYFYFWVDDTDYTPNQRIKIVLSHANFENKEYDDLDIIQTQDYSYYPNPDAADQGAATTTGDQTIKDFVDSIGTSKSATIILNHNGSGNTTTYTLTTSETIPSNITLKVESGAILDGAGTLTQNGPFECGLQACFGSSITVVLSSGVNRVAQAEWFGFSASASAANNATFVGAAFTAVGAGGTVYVSIPGTYSVAAFTISTANLSFLSTGGRSAVDLSYTGTSNFITLNANGIKVDGFLLTGPDGAAAAGDVGIKIANSKWRCIISNNILNDWDVGIHDDGFYNAIESNYIADFTTYGIKIDSTSSGCSYRNYLTTSKGGSESAFYINATHYTSYSDIIGICDVGYEMATCQAITIIDPHLETPVTYDFKCTTTTTTISILGGRFAGTFRSGTSGTTSTDWVIQGASIQDAFSFANSTYSKIEIRNCNGAEYWGSYQNAELESVSYENTQVFYENEEIKYSEILWQT